MIPGEQSDACEECGEETSPVEIMMHNGYCKCCYDDFHFGEDEEL